MRLLREFEDAVADLLTADRPSAVGAARTPAAQTAPPAAASAMFALPAPRQGGSGSIVAAGQGGSLALVAPGTRRSRLPGQGGASGAAWSTASQAQRDGLLARYDERLSRFYMWAQTPALLLVAVRMPTGAAPGFSRALRGIAELAWVAS